MKRLLASLLALAMLAMCAPALAEALPAADIGLTVTGSLPLEYATQFSVDFCEGGYSLITNGDGARFLTIP